MDKLRCDECGRLGDHKMDCSRNYSPRNQRGSESTVEVHSDNPPFQRTVRMVQSGWRSDGTIASGRKL